MTEGFRLRGEIEGEDRYFPLAEGVQIVGSSRSTDIPVTVPGLSRRHAEISLEHGEVRVRDLGSRNGTFIGGRRLGDGVAFLGVGDELRLGPVRLTLERADIEEARLGLELDRRSWSRTHGGGPETAALSREQPLSNLALDLAVATVELLTLPRPDLQAVADRLLATLELRTLAFIERPSPAERPVVLAASGEAEPLETLGPPLAEKSELAGACRIFTAGDASIGLFACCARGSVLPRRLLDAVLQIVVRLYSAPEAGSIEQGIERGDGHAGLELPPGIVAGRSPEMVELYQQLASVAGTELPVLLLGETGVGKEHLAEAVHRSSARRGGPFVAVNCAAIPAEQLEAEMFGIGKGVATGVDARPGCFLRASGGTLLLDEIGELPAPLQAKLLRALQDGQVHPVGLPPRTADVRIVAATNVELEAQIASGDFRADLYYRLAGAELQVPPLRRRRQDLGALMAHFLGQAADQSGKRIRGLSVKALRLLSDYPWPGNVRELAYEMRRLALRSRPHQVIDSTLLSPRIRDAAAPDQAALADLGSGTSGLEERLDSLQDALIRQALRATAGNQTRAAKKLGLSRSGLVKRMKRLGIDAKAYGLA